MLDIILLAFVTFYHPDSSFRYAVIAFDIAICVVLWIEFIYSYLHSEDKKYYLKDNALSVLGMLPVDFVFFRALRLLKLIQLIKLYILARETQGNVSKFLKNTYLDKIILVAIIFIFIITVLILFFDPAIDSFRTALWFIVVSMTSTGYGDVVPSTTSGQIIGIMAMIGGILIFATLTAVISSLYVSKISRDKHDALESKIDDLTCEIEKLNEKIDELKKE